MTSAWLPLRGPDGPAVHELRTTGRSCVLLWTGASRRRPRSRTASHFLDEVASQGDTDCPQRRYILSSGPLFRQKGVPSRPNAGADDGFVRRRQTWRSKSRTGPGAGSGSRARIRPWRSRCNRRANQAVRGSRARTRLSGDCCSQVRQTHAGACRRPGAGRRANGSNVRGRRMVRWRRIPSCCSRP